MVVSFSKGSGRLRLLQLHWSCGTSYYKYVCCFRSTRLRPVEISDWKKVILPGPGAFLGRGNRVFNEVRLIVQFRAEFVWLRLWTLNILLTTLTIRLHSLCCVYILCIPFSSLQAFSRSNWVLLPLSLHAPLWK